MKYILTLMVIIIMISVLWTPLTKLEGGFRIEKIFANSYFPFSENTKETPSSNSKKPKTIIVKKEAEKEVEVKKELPVQLKISSVHSKSANNPSLITLSYKSGKEKIDITGYKIKTRQGEFVIPQGVEKYSSSLFEKDIVVGQYATIYLIGGQSPLARKNFETNKCFGYLSRTFDFYPSVWSSCPPKPKQEELSNLQPYCQDFILRSSGCKTPDYQNNLKISIDSECVSYINQHFNYNSCFNNYSNDSDFLKNRWYIYTGSNIVEPLHDTVYLYDRNNILLDKFSY
jgi:hypothetical protein